MAPRLTLLMSSGSKKQQPRYTCLSKAKSSHSQRIWAKVSSSAPHLLHLELSDTSFQWRCLHRVLRPVRRPVTALDCVLLKDRNLVFGTQTGSRNYFLSLSLGVTKTSPPYSMLVRQRTSNPSSYILPGDSQVWLRSNELQNRVVSRELISDLITSYPSMWRLRWSSV